MSARALLERLAAAGLTVTVTVTAADRLHIEPASKLSDELPAAVVTMKAELLVVLARADESVEPRPSRAQEQELPDQDGVATESPSAPPPVSSEVSSEKAPVSRHERRLEHQRQLRAKRHRIDYYPSDEAIRVLAALRNLSAGGNVSSIINRALIRAATPDARS